MPRDYKNNTYRTRKPQKRLGLDGWDRVLIVVFITVLALVIKHFILIEREKESNIVTEVVAASTQSDAKVATATSTVASIAKEMAAAGGLTDEEMNADPKKIAAQQAKAEAEKKLKAIGVPVPARQDSIPVEPHFDFYTILPKVEVVIPDHEIKTRIREEKLGEGDKGAKYIMQAGSFRDAPDAEKLKAKLIAMGIEARTEKAQVGEVIWYRVKVGPYTGMTSVMTVKTQLRDHGIDAIVLEFK